MADFSVPIATNTLSSIDSLIANAPGAMKIGEALGNLPDAYWAGQNQAYQQRNRNLFQNGIPADMATELLKAQGTAGVPEYIALQKLQAGQELANKPEPTMPQFAPGVSGYTPPVQSNTGPPSSTPQAQAPEQQGGRYTLRDYATARGLNVDELVQQTGRNPDEPLDADQRQQIIPTLRSAAQQPMPQRAPNTRVAQTFGALPPSTGAPAGTPGAQPQLSGGAMPGAQPVQTQQVAQAPDQQAQAQERNAALEEYKANIYRQRAKAASANGDEGLAKQFGAQADFHQAQSTDIRKSLLERYQLTTGEKDVRNPAVRSGAALTAVDKGDAEAYGKDYGAVSNQARIAATQGLSRVDELKTLTTSPNFYSGPFAKGMQSYRQFQATFGRDPQAATPMEAFNKGVKDILTEQIKGLAAAGVGRVNLAEVRNMQSATATLENTPAGNRAQLEVLRRSYLQQQAVGQIADRVNQEIAAGRVPPGQFRSRLNQAIDNYAAQNKMFTPAEQKNPVLLGAVDAPPNYAQMNLPQRRQWGAQRNIRPNDPIRLPDGSYGHAD